MDHTQVFELPGSIPGEPDPTILPVTPLKIRKISLSNPNGLIIVPTTPITSTSPPQIPLRSPSRPSINLNRPDANWSASKPLPSLPITDVPPTSYSLSRPSLSVERPPAQESSPTNSHASDLSGASTAVASTISAHLSNSTVHPGSSASHTPPRSTISSSAKFQSGNAQSQMKGQIEKPTPSQKIKDGAFFAFVLLPLSCWYTRGGKRLGPEGDATEGVDEPARKRIVIDSSDVNNSSPSWQQSRIDRSGGKGDDLSSRRGVESENSGRGVRQRGDLSSGRGSNSRGLDRGARQSEGLGASRGSSSGGSNGRTTNTGPDRVPTSVD